MDYQRVVLYMWICRNTSRRLDKEQTTQKRKVQVMKIWEIFNLYSVVSFLGKVK